MKNPINLLLGLFVLTLLFVNEGAYAKGLKTKLKIIVVDEAGTKLEGVKVTLFKTEEDYRAETNPVASLMTNKKGMVKFKPLNPAEYYVLAEKDKMSNIGQSVKIEMLDEGKKNLVTTLTIK